MPRTESDASLQARIPLDVARYLRWHPVGVVVWLSGALGTLAGAVLWTGGWQVAAALGFALWGAAAYLLLRAAAMQAWLGDVCPAVALTPVLGAAYADLTLGDGHFPILRAFRLARSHTARTQLATACWYFVSDQNCPCWSELCPNPLSEFSADEKLVAARTSEIPSNLWISLAQSLEFVEPQEAGLYPLPGGDWPEAWLGSPITSKMIEHRYLSR